MRFIKNLFCSNKKTIKQKVMNYGKVDFLLTDEWNRSHDLATAVAKDGVVYLGTKEAGIIGRYEKIDSDKMKVFGAGGQWIGVIQGEKIILTAAEDYEYFKDVNPCIGKPEDFYFYAAHIGINKIYDGITNELVATIEGNKYEAAVAFICLVYDECKTGNRYGEYFHAWKH